MINLSQNLSSICLQLFQCEIQLYFFKCITAKYFYHIIPFLFLPLNLLPPMSPVYPFPAAIPAGCGGDWCAVNFIIKESKKPWQLTTCFHQELGTFCLNFLPSGNTSIPHRFGFLFLFTYASTYFAPHKDTLRIFFNSYCISQILISFSYSFFFVLFCLPQLQAHAVPLLECLF